MNDKEDKGFTETNDGRTGSVPVDIGNPEYGTQRGHGSFPDRVSPTRHEVYGRLLKYSLNYYSLFRS